MEKSLLTSVRYLKGIGPKKAKAFAAAGIHTVEDLLYHFPRRYEDRRNFSEISKLQPGLTYTVKARVLARNHRRSFKRRGFSITEVAVGDAKARIFCVWFNQPYLKEYFKVGVEVILYGKVELYAGRLQMNSPEFEFVSGEGEESLDIGRITPVYSLPEGSTQRSLRRLVKLSLEEYLPALAECISYDIRQRNNLLNLAQGLLNIHFPESDELQQEAFRRLSFEEFFLFQVPLALRKARRHTQQGIAHATGGSLVPAFIGNLGFVLTKSQQQVIEEIRQDMGKPVPMQRLLQGDVGSGKTVVATIAALFAIQGGYQAAFMAPTEILAKQHYEKISRQFSLLGAEAKKAGVALLTGSAAAAEKKRVLQEIKEGSVSLVVGTHALLEGKVLFKNLGLAVIDEQHKFGVGQRALLPAKGRNPDILIMTATPIPRTLAITLYGDLDISVITELPAGRLPVKTIAIDKKKKGEAYDIVKDELLKGNQAYIVYPVIEESYALDIAGAEKMYQELKDRRFKEFNVGLVHGRLKQEVQDEAMRGFKEGKINVLVATTVLEVGIDVPNATCMVIEHAERFGLSQLHQLRGRIGRGPEQSFCILVSAEASEQAKMRLEAMVKFSDGFRIAEEDLKIRGPGEFFGSRQHGLTELKIGNPLTQLTLLKKAREEALGLVAKDPALSDKLNRHLKEELLRRFPGYEHLMVTG